MGHQKGAIFLIQTVMIVILFCTFYIKNVIAELAEPFGCLCIRDHPMWLLAETVGGIVR